MSSPGSLTDGLVNRISRHVDATSNDVLDFLKRLVSFPTASQNPDDQDFSDGIRACHAFLADSLQAMGVTVDTWLARPMTFPEHPVLVGTLRGGGGGRSLALNGHVDTVAVGDASAWNRHPMAGEVSDGKLWGRGTCDMKAGVAAMIQAVRALRDCEIRLKGDVYIHIVSDEEVVGFGSRECAERAPRPDFVLVTEPTRLDVVTVEGGLEHLRIEIEGREEHAGRRYASNYPRDIDPGSGVNAIEKGVRIVQALQDVERSWALFKRHPYLPAGFNSILPGVFIGGAGGGRDGRLNITAPPGTTPSYCAIEYNIWYYPGETLDDVKRDIEGYVLSLTAHDPWLRVHPPKFTWGLRNVSFPPVSTDPDHEVVTTLVSILHRMGCVSQVAGFTAASDLAWYSMKGIPGAIFGPGDIAQAHGPDEFVPISDVVNATKAIALVILSWCGYEVMSPG